MGDGAFPSLLVSEYISARNANTEKKRRRAYHRVVSGLHKSGRLRFITLTSSNDAPADFQRSFRKLYMRLKRRTMLVDYIRVAELTKRGVRHEHILFRGTYIQQSYLSYLWNQIHRSPVVDIRAIRDWGSKRRVAGYVAKYLSKASCGRTSYSWGWVFKGFVGQWELLKKGLGRLGCGISAIIKFWEGLIRIGRKPVDFLSQGRLSGSPNDIMRACNLYYLTKGV